MGSWIRRLFQELLLLILKLIDGISQMFNILLGLSPVTYKNGDGTATELSIVDWFLKQDVVVQVFLVLFVISVVVLAVCCIAAIIRSMFHNGDGERKPATRIVGQGLRSLMTTLVVAVITISAIGGANTLLVTVNKTFNSASGQPTSISRVVLELGLTNGETTDWQTMEYVRYYQVNGELNDKAQLDGIQDNYETESQIDEWIRKNGDIYDVENGSWRWFITVRVSNGGIRSQQKLNELFDENGYLRADVSSDKIWGWYTTNWVGLPDGGWNSNDAALEGATYNALIPYIAAFILLYILAMTSFTLVKRLFDIITLFFVLPFVNATVPLDDGAHMKLWRETMISKVLMAYGAVFALGVFTLFAPLCNQVMLGDNGTMTAVLRLVLLCGGGLSIQGGMALFARLIGTGIAESNDMGATARTLLAGGAGALFMGAKAVGAGKNILFGSKGGAGGAGTTGLLSLAGGALNTSGKLLGGSAYVNRKAKMGAGVKKAVGAVKSTIMKNGGLIGGVAKAVRAPFKKKKP